MVLATGPFNGFAPFVQVFLWVGLVFFLFVAIITAFIHLWAKRKSKKLLKDNELMILPTPESINALSEKPDYILFDHSNLIQQYKVQLTTATARYMVLKQDINRLRDEYVELQNSTGRNNSTNTNNTNKTDMDNLELQNDLSPQAQESQMEQWYVEKNELTHRLQQVNTAYQSLEKENQALLQQIDILTSGSQKENVSMEEWEKERLVMKCKIAEQEYLKDVIEEKNMQIGFLQNQLEQRIKHYHQLEQQHNESISGLRRLQEEVQKQDQHLAAMREEIENRQIKSSEVQTLLDEKEKQQQDWMETLRIKEDRIVYLENELKERIKQNELLNAEVGDKRDILAAMKEEIDFVRENAVKLEQKLEHNKEWLRRVQKEAARAVEAQEDSQPVIAMSPVYHDAETNNGWG